MLSIFTASSTDFPFNHSVANEDEAIADIRARAEARKESGLIGGVREWFDIDYLLRVIDKYKKEP